MDQGMNRRTFLRTAGLASAALSFGLRHAAAAAPRADILETQIISWEPQYYHGWPTLCRRRNGDLLVVCSGGREKHVCPFGRVDLMVSHDQGRTWGWPQVIIDTAMDDRDAGILETAKGSLIATTFTSLAYETELLKQIKNGKGKDSDNAWPEDRLKAWLAAYSRLSADQRREQLGLYSVRSTDGGATWSPLIPTLVNSPHGPTQLSDGRLLYTGKELWSKSHRVGVSESLDDGQTWRWLAEIPTRPGDNPLEYHELHAVETRDGRIIAQIRNQNKASLNETLQTESADGGKTWSVPHTIGVWGLPSFLTRLKDGRLLMTYGYRRAPFGNQARFSEDDGKTWSEPLTISSDGMGGDLGYPSTVELEDGTFLTVWYETMKGNPHAVLRQARWRAQA
jgi:hypothetical protein